jgi:hypothetical protein
MYSNRRISMLKPFVPFTIHYVASSNGRTIATGHPSDVLRAVSNFKKANGKTNLSLKAVAVARESQTYARR